MQQTIICIMSNLTIPKRTQLVHFENGLLWRPDFMDTDSLWNTLTDNE